MNKKYLITLFLVSFWIHPIVQTNITIFQQFLCEVDLTKYIDFSNDRKCLRIVVNPNSEMECLAKFLGSNAISLRIISHNFLLQRNISSEDQGCETFLIFTESIDVAINILRPNQIYGKQFFPFSKIYFYLPESKSQSTNAESTSILRNFLTVNALFGYTFELAKDKKVLIRDFLTNDIKLSMSSYTPSDFFHPMVDISLIKESFNISLFNCKPFTFDTQSTSPGLVDENTMVNNLDGTEYRFVQELTKNWKKNYKFRDTKVSPYLAIMDDLSNKSSDMAMCSIWIVQKYLQKHDLTGFYDLHCMTLLVPKPMKLNEISAIYTTLKPFVWWLLLFSFILSSVVLNVIAKIETRLFKRYSVFSDFPRTFMETLSSATSHSVDPFPRGHISLEILLSSWILLSLWMGICYTTIYTSRLASPGYEKLVNNVKQFVDYGLYICDPYQAVVLYEQFGASINEDYRQLSTRIILYGDNKQYLRQLILDRKCGIFVNRMMKNYVNARTFEGDMDLLYTLRVMRRCVSNQYTGFAFQKHSPYTKLFSWHIQRYQEYGIMQKWYLDILKDEKEIRTLFEDYPELGTHRRIKLINVSGAFFLLATGLTLSVIVFFVEFIYCRRM